MSFDSFLLKTTGISQLIGEPVDISPTRFTLMNVSVYRQPLRNRSRKSKQRTRVVVPSPSLPGRQSVPTVQTRYFI